MSAEHDRLLDPAGLDGLEHRPLTEIRSQRAACIDVETGLSYLRRLVQGSIDIIEREIQHRSGHGQETTEDVVQALPDILGDAPRPAGYGRLPQSIEPPDLDDDLVREYDRIIGDGRLAHVADVDDAALHSLVESLYGIEQQVSAKRHAFHTRIDALQAEITRRYRTGEATVDSLLEST
jgi:hypothetical protein